MSNDPAVIYFVGENGPVDVPLARAADVKFGDAVHVPDERVREGLLIQDGSWSATPPEPAAVEPAAKPKPKSDPAPAGADTPKE